MSSIHNSFFVIVFSFLTFYSFGQVNSEYLLGSWKIDYKKDSTVILRKANKMNFKRAFLLITKNDSIHISIRKIGCGMIKLNDRYGFRKGAWKLPDESHINIEYCTCLAFVQQEFEIRSVKKRRIVLRLLSSKESEEIPEVYDIY